MQYLEVVVNQPADRKTKTFTYLIPPELLSELKVGSIVEVPFGRELRTGIAYRLTRLSPRGKKLKAIKSLLSSGVISPNIIFPIADSIYKKGFQSFSDIVFSLLPPLPKRKLRETKLLLKEQELKSPGQAKIYFQEADFSARPELYLQLIKRARARKMGVIVLSLSLESGVIKELEKRLKASKIKSLVYSSRLTASQQLENWFEIALGRFPVILGARSAAMTPVPNLGLTIIDDAEHQLFRSEMRPYLDTQAVALERTRLEGGVVVMVDATEKSRTALAKKEGKIIGLTPRRGHREIELADLKRSRSWLSDASLNLLESNLVQKRKTLIYWNRKRSSGLKCFDCQELTFLNRGDRILRCPNCEGLNLKAVGLNHQLIKSRLLELMPNQAIEIFPDDDSTGNEKLALIGTSSMIHKTGGQPDSIVLVLEQGLAAGSFEDEEEIYYNIARLISRSRKTIIQTFSPNSLLARALFNRKSRPFFDSLLRERAELLLPPFSKLIELKTNKTERVRLEKQISGLGLEPIGQGRDSIIVRLPKRSKIELDKIIARLSRSGLKIGREW